MGNRRRQEMIRRAEKLEEELAERRRRLEQARKDREREKCAEAAEARSMSATRGEGLVAQEKYFEGATRRVVALAPRIPHKPATTEQVKKITLQFPLCTLDEIRWGVEGSAAAQRELETYLFQETEPEKPLAKVLPHSHKDVPRTLPIETGQPAGPLEWDLPTPQPPRRSRSRSTSRRRSRGEFPEVVAGPPGVPVWELAGARASAPGEGRHRKKSREPNPRRHLQMEDFEFFHLGSGDERANQSGVSPMAAKRKVETARDQGETTRKSPTPSCMTEARTTEATRASPRPKPAPPRTAQSTPPPLLAEPVTPADAPCQRKVTVCQAPPTTQRPTSILRPAAPTRAADQGSTRVLSWVERQVTGPSDPERTGARPREVGPGFRPRGSREVSLCARGRDNPQPFGQFFRDMNEVPYNAMDPPSNACHNCWSRYHERRTCPRPRTLFCKNCGRKDIHVSECPRCADGWRRYQQREYRRQQRRKEAKLQRDEAKRDQTGSSTYRETCPSQPSGAPPVRSREPSAESSASVSSQVSDTDRPPNSQEIDAFLDRISHLTPEAQSRLIAARFPPADRRSRSRTRSGTSAEEEVLPRKGKKAE